MSSIQTLSSIISWTTHVATTKIVRMAWMQVYWIFFQWKAKNTVWFQNYVIRKRAFLVLLPEMFVSKIPQALPSHFKTTDHFGNDMYRWVNYKNLANQKIDDCNQFKNAIFSVKYFKNKTKEDIKRLVSGMGISLSVTEQKIAAAGWGGKAKGLL